LRNKYYSGHHRAVEGGGGQRTLGGEIWEKKCRQRGASRAGEKWRRQHKTELDEKE